MLRSLLVSSYFTIACFASSVVSAHDTWVQAGPLVSRHRDVVHVDLMLGNHGNQHRDFKLASKITLKPCTLEAIAPDGKSIDLKDRLVDLGSAEKEGYWSARLITEQEGVYQILHTLDTLHGKVRAIKSSKTFVVSTRSLNSFSTKNQSSIRPIGKGLEFVLESSLVELGAKRPLNLQLLWNGSPLANTRVSFIPRGAVLQEGIDPNYERTTDEAGRVTFTPAEGNFILAVAHHVAENEKGMDTTRHITVQPWSCLFPNRRFPIHSSVFKSIQVQGVTLCCCDNLSYCSS